MPIRMRLAPSKTEMICDSCQWSDLLRAQAIAGCDDVLAFAQKLNGLAEFKESLCKPVTTQLQVLKDLGLRWDGGPIQRQHLMKLLAILPFCDDPFLIAAWNKLIGPFGEINKLTMMGRLCGAAKTFLKGTFLSPELHAKSSCVTALGWALEWLYVTTISGDADKSKMSANHLLGEKSNEVGGMHVFFRKLQILDVIWHGHRASQKYDSAIGEALWDKFSSPCAFLQSFAPPDFWQLVEAIAEGQDKKHGENKGICAWLDTPFNEFLETLPGEVAVSLAELLYGLMTTEFDLEILGECRKKPDGAIDYESLMMLLRVPAGEEPEAGTLQAAYQKYSQALAGVAVKIDLGDHDDRAPFQGNVEEWGQSEDGGEASSASEKQLLYVKLVAAKDKQIRFQELPQDPAGPLKHYKNPTELNKIFTTSGFQELSVRAVGTKEAKIRNRVFLLSADLFPGCMATGDKDFQLPSKRFDDTPVPDAFKTLFSWVLSAKRSTDQIAFFDGRFRKLRRYVEQQLANLDEKFLVEIWMVYKKPDDNDPRYPSRKLAFSNTNRETILMYRPISRRSTTSQPRAQYNVCGEESTHDCTYTAVKLRSLGELPKLTAEDKKAMLGTELDIPSTYQDESIVAVAEEQGIPFSWLETKPVAFWTSFFDDMEFDDIFDCTVGSAAAAIGAYYGNKQYDGICCNPLHKKWAGQIMNKAMFAVIADGGAKADKECIAKVMHFFGPAIDEGMRLLQATKKLADKKKDDTDPKDGDDDPKDGVAKVDDDGFGDKGVPEEFA